MHVQRRFRRSAVLTLGVALLMALPAGIAAQEPGEGGGDGGANGVGSVPQPASQQNLLAPIATKLSGRAWLMSEGLEPSLIQGPGEGGLTGPDWSALNGGLMGVQHLQGATAGALVPYRDPSPAFSSNDLVTRDFSNSPYQTEPNIAVDPADPQHIVLGTIDYNFPSMSTYVSYDGGETWDGPSQSPFVLQDDFSGGDPSLAFDRASNVYMTSISIGEEDFTVGPIAITSEVSSIAVASSQDGGYTWPANISTARSKVTTSGLTPDRFGQLRGDITIGFFDKPWISIGPDAKDPTKDVVYVTYTDFETVYEVLWLGELPTLVATQTKTSIQAVHSDDQGQTWSDPVNVSPVVAESYGEPLGSTGGEVTKRSVQGSQPTVLPDGTVVVAWLDSTDDEAMKGLGEIYVARSTDGGASFTQPIRASTFDEIGFRPRTSFFRYWGSEFPQLASGPNGEMYIAYVARPPDNLLDDGDVYLVSSFDKGDTWSTPQRLNDDDGNALQFFPSVTVDPTGAVHAMWGDMRDDPAQTRYSIYYTRSDDQGKTWGFTDQQLGLTIKNTRVSDFASNPNLGFPNGLFLGDYFSIRASSPDDVYMVWADTRLGEYGGPNQKIGFARRQAVPGPEVYLSPASGPGGQQVTLQGFGYQPMMNVFVQLGDSTIATARTDRDGNFSSVLYMPVTSQGGQTLSAVDESGNLASTSFFTEYGIGDLRQDNQNLQDQLNRIQQLLGASPAPSTSPAP
jgi:hypothetical protein